MAKINPRKEKLIVPLHKSRFRQRGFNQSSLLARKTAEAFGLSFKDNVLLRIRKTRPQVELSGKARQENIKDAFKCLKPEKIKGRDILLLDDVCTTGSTLAERVFWLSFSQGTLSSILQ